MSAAHLYAVTVVGRDRPGIIAETTARLADLGLDLRDSTMTLLRGQLAMVLLCAGEAEETDIESALASLTIDRSLSVTAVEIPTESAPSTPGASWVLTVHGGERAGVVSAIVAEVAAVDGNITGLTTRPSGEVYVLVAEIMLPSGVDAAALEAAVDRVAAELGVRATLRPSDIEDL